jgi:hypothetical protein
MEMNMHNEKQNDTNWINKLDEPACLPAQEMIDKNAAWERLYERLRKKRWKNKMIWYWAAACLFIAFSLPIIIVRKNTNSIVKEVSQKNKKEPQPIANSSSMPERAGTEGQNVLMIEKKEGNPVIRKRTISNLHAPNAQVKKISRDANSENAKATRQELIINTVTSVDIPSPMITVLAVKKKMRVVHINELENAEDGIASSITDRQQSTFSMSFGNNTQTTKQTSPARDYAGIFKIKISSKN